MKNLDQEMKDRIVSLTDDALVKMMESKPGEYRDEALILGNEEAERRGGLTQIKSSLFKIDKEREEEEERKLKIRQKEEDDRWDSEVEEIQSKIKTKKDKNLLYSRQSPAFMKPTSSNPLLGISVILLFISAIATIWGYDYTQKHKMVGIVRGFGYREDGYEVAQFSMLIGIIIFLVGIGLLIGSFIKRNQVIIIQQNQELKCLHIDETGIFCSKCGERID